MLKCDGNQIGTQNFDIFEKSTTEAAYQMNARNLDIQCNS